MKYKIGDVVQLSPESRWAEVNRYNPLNHPGRVLDYSEGSGYTVEWFEIGRNDFYFEHDLIPGTKLSEYLLGIDTEQNN
jgi:hypothetical protein